MAAVLVTGGAGFIGSNLVIAPRYGIEDGLGLTVKWFMRRGER